MKCQISGVENRYVLVFERALTFEEYQGMKTAIAFAFSDEGRELLEAERKGVAVSASASGGRR